jgi:nicotinate-nucleotide adenylyltransferase
MRIAILGGSFNPPHLGHMFICQYVLATNRADQVWIMPVYKHAFYKKLLDYSERMDMCNAIAKEFRFGDVQTCGAEMHTLVNDVNRTLPTIMALCRKYPNHKFSFVMGSDIYWERKSWHEFDSLKKFADIIIIGRVGYKCPTYSDDTIQIPNISSTDIRERIREGKTIDHLVHHSVLHYVDKIKNLKDE